MNVKTRIEALEQKHDDPTTPGQLPTLVADGDTDTMEKLLAKGINALYYSDAIHEFV